MNLDHAATYTERVQHTLEDTAAYCAFQVWDGKPNAYVTAAREVDGMVCIAGSWRHPHPSGMYLMAFGLVFTRTEWAVIRLLNTQWTGPRDAGPHVEQVTR